jgi:hypothetical protein
MARGLRTHSLTQNEIVLAKGPERNRCAKRPEKPFQKWDVENLTSTAERFFRKLLKGLRVVPRATFLALFYCVSGDVDNAGVAVEKAIEQRDPDVMVFMNLAVSRALRSGPRWPAIARLMNLPESAS